MNAISAAKVYEALISEYVWYLRREIGRIKELVKRYPALRNNPDSFDAVKKYRDILESIQLEKEYFSNWGWDISFEKVKDVIWEKVQEIGQLFSESRGIDDKKRLA